MFGNGRADVLAVSDLIEVARSATGAATARARSPLRYAAPGQNAPVVIWNVCMHCNMSCPHCYAAAVSKPSPSDLGHDRSMRLLEEMAASGVRIVIFSGGEPLLRGDLFQLLARASELGIAPQLSTNGVLIDADVAKRLADRGVAYVGISIDGLPDWNDDYRGLGGGFEAARNGLRHAKAAGMRTGLRMTVTRRNVDQLDAVVDVAEEVGADRFYASHLVYSGRGYHVSGDDLDREEARRLLVRLFELAEKRLEDGRLPRIVTGSNDSGGPFLLRWIEERHGAEAAVSARRLLALRGGNSAGEKILNIDSSGRVHPDQFWRAAVLGDLREQTFADVLRHPLREQLARRLDRIEGRCRLCAERNLCRGSHRERAWAATRNAWASDPACVMYDAEIGVNAVPPFVPSPKEVV